MKAGRLLVVLALVGAGCAPRNSQEAPSGAAGVVGGSGAVECLVERTAASALATGTAPSFVVDPGWPKTLPNNWRLGQIGGVFVDRHDSIWVYHRPRSLNSNEAGALDVAGKDAKGNPVSALGHPRPFGQHSGCCVPAPSVLQFDKAGNLLQAWGGPADPGFLETKCRPQDGCFWPAREHGIYVDHNDFVYIAGNGENFTGQFPWSANFGDDSHVLKFKADGTFVYQIGHAGKSAPNSDDINSGPNGTPQPYLPADMTVDPNTNHLYLADGYGNRGTLIVDAATGKYVGHFVAYGQNPIDGESTVFGDDGYEAGQWAADFRKGELKPKAFRSPLHCAKLSKDGLLYACDRGNNRIQVFKTSEVGKPCSNPDGDEGKCGFVGEVAIAPQTVAGTSEAVNFSIDPEQGCIYVADLSNNTIWILNRQNLHELGRLVRVGRSGSSWGTRRECGLRGQPLHG